MLVCPECSCDKIEALVWVMANTGEPASNDVPERWYCPECDENFKHPENAEG